MELRLSVAEHAQIWNGIACIVIYNQERDDDQGSRNEWSFLPFLAL